jgi:hypothetical protein
VTDSERLMLLTAALAVAGAIRVDSNPKSDRGADSQVVLLVREEVARQVRESASAGSGAVVVDVLEKAALAWFLGCVAGTRDWPGSGPRSREKAEGR